MLQCQQVTRGPKVSSSLDKAQASYVRPDLSQVPWANVSSQLTDVATSCSCLIPPYCVGDHW